MVISANAQITNNGFENWTTVGSYENPTGWATMNSLAAGPFYSCTKSTDHYPVAVGNYSIRLENNTALTQATGGYGMAVTDTMAYPFRPSFPISGHPNSLCGYYKYFPQNDDTMFIRIILFNNGILVGNHATESGVTTSSWTSFNVPLDYTSADSATILMSAFFPQGPTDGPHGNSVLYVDNLSFDNLITSINVSATDLSTESPVFNLNPNPASDVVALSIIRSYNGRMVINIYDLDGTLVKSETLKQTAKN